MSTMGKKQLFVWKETMETSDKFEVTPKLAI